MNRYKGIISTIIKNQINECKDLKVGMTQLNEYHTSYDSYVERVGDAFDKIYNRLKYLCPVKVFQSEREIPVIYTGYTYGGHEVFTQRMCYCEWDDESLPEQVLITWPFGSPETILKRAYKQKPISVRVVDFDELKKTGEAFTPDELESLGCKLNAKGGTGVQVHWINYVAKIDNKNKESRKQEWLNKQNDSYQPEVKKINVMDSGEGWTVKTGFKFVKQSDDTLSRYRTVWQDSSGELYGFNQKDYMHKMWCPSFLVLWAENPEKLEIENVKEGVEKAVNNVIQNSNWFEFCWLGKYHSIKRHSWENDIPRSMGMNDFINDCKDYYNDELSKKLPLKLVKWEKI